MTIKKGNKKVSIKLDLVIKLAIVKPIFFFRISIMIKKKKKNELNPTKEGFRVIFLMKLEHFSNMFPNSFFLIDMINQKTFDP